MRLIPWEEERLLIFTAAELARRHRAAGLRLNHPEAVALICDAMLEAARGGASYEEVEAAGRAAVAPTSVMRRRVATLLDEVRLEVLLGDGVAAGRARRSARRRRGRLRPARRDPAGAVRRRADPRPTATAGRSRSRNTLTPGRPRLVPLPVRAGERRGSTSTARPPPASGSTSRPGRT